MQLSYNIENLKALILKTVQVFSKHSPMFCHTISQSITSKQSDSTVFSSKARWIYDHTQANASLYDGN